VMMGSTDLGTQQMLSVPYALYAGSTHVSVSPTGDTLTVGGQSVIVPGVSGANNILGQHSCGTGNVHNSGMNYGVVSDYEGNNYKTIVIGQQEWMAENLKSTRFSNGDLIGNVEDGNLWASQNSPAYCYYNNNQVSYSCPYGILYNWLAVSDSRNVCPTGWHVSTDLDWKDLETTLGMTSVELNIENGGRGSNENIGGKLKSLALWNAPNSGATNEVGFSAVPSGNRYGETNAIFSAFGTGSYFWTSTPVGNGFYYFRHLNSYDNKINRANDAFGNEGFALRCVKNIDTPIQGCTDGAACNFLANANQDDGSCLYLNATCDDGNANTTNDVINGSCVCAGTPLINGIYAMGNGVTDIDGNTYTSIIINGQEWMQKNLTVTKYRNGDPIPTGLDNATWSSTTSGAYAIYNNDPANNIMYGKLYNWYVVNDSRGVCPTGWHVPSDLEWSAFINYLDPNANGGDVWPNTSGGKIKATTGWNSPNVGATNVSAYSGLPGGSRYQNGSYNVIGGEGFWWTSTENDSIYAWFRTVSYLNSNVYRFKNPKQNGYNVRCVRD
jgi:uncharacterized protein (TIGR02145 family)